MCGGFACALRSARREGSSWLLQQSLYNGGRLATYGFIGMLAGTLGQGLNHVQIVYAAHSNHEVGWAGISAVDGSLGLAQRALSVIAGLLMVVMALQLFGFLGRRHSTAGFGAASLATVLGSIIRSPGIAAPLALGVANGFLPCPLVYAFAVQAAATGTLLPGIMTMVVFGLGTFPAMFMMSGLSGFLDAVWRARGVRLAAVFVFVLGLVTALRGLLPAELLHAYLPEHAV